jgi:hypothetical protein
MSYEVADIFKTKDELTPAEQRSSNQIIINQHKIQKKAK